MTLKYANNAANSFRSFKDVSSQTQWPPFWGHPAFQQLPQNRPTFHTSHRTYIRRTKQIRAAVEVTLHNVRIICSTASR